MKKPGMIMCLLLCFFTGSSQSAKTEALIRQQEQAVVKAILENDTVSLKALWAPEFLVNNPRNTISPNRVAVLETQKAGMINYSRFEREIESIQVRRKMVITMGQEIFVSRNDIPGAKANQPVKRRFTNIWIKQKGRWWQVARHASIICAG